MLFFFVILWAALLIPAPSIAIGWVQFIRAKNRFDAPRWRGIAGFSSLILASLIGIFFLAVSFLMPDGIDSVRGPGIWASFCCVVLSLAGRGPLRLPVSTASVALACLWFEWRIDI
jgi:hypothetical protein